MLTAKTPRARRLARSAWTHKLTALSGGAGLRMSGEGGGSPRRNLLFEVVTLPFKILASVIEVLFIVCVRLPFQLVNALFHVLL